jgi:GcrA cell cycle regulator
MTSTHETIYAQLEKYSRFLTVSIGTNRLAREIGCSSTTVQTNLHRMAAEGWIEFIHAPTPERAGIYRLIPPESRRQRCARRLEDLVTKVWPLTILEQLVDLWGEGHSAAEIGRRLGQTKNAIIGRAHRLVDHGIIEPRASPIIRDGSPRPVKARPAPTLPPLSSGIVVPTAQPRLAPTFRPGFNFVRAIEQPRFEPIARQVEAPCVIEIKPMTAKCLFPLWGDGPPTHKFCNAASPLGSSWCDHHHKIVFIRSRGYAAC